MERQTLCKNCGYIHQTSECSVNQTQFIWKYGGVNAFIVGSWSQWQAKIQMNTMSKKPNHFSAILNLPAGKYEYKYIIDGDWYYDISKPVKDDGNGGYNNFLEVVPQSVTANQSDSEDDMFSIHDQNSEEVCIKIRTNMDAPDMQLVGSWDNWSEKIVMKRKFSHIHNNYLHEAKLHLPAGKYEYKFISQDTYMHDPEQKVVQNGLGNYNNMVIVNEYTMNNKKQNQKIKSMYWTSSKVSSEFQFDQMLLGHSINIVGNIVYIFGGCRGGHYTNNFWSYNIKEQEIEHVNYVGTAPSCRAYHKTVSFGNKILFYGGLDNNRILTDYYVFNTSTNSWHTSTPVGQRPSQRERFTISMYKNFAAILFGGYYCSQDLEAEQHYNSLFSLNLQKMCWTELKPDGVLPEPRFAHTSNSYKQYIVIFGGLNQHINKRVFNDCWRIGLENQQLYWENVSLIASGQPPVGRYSHSATMVNDYLVIFGGRTASQETLNDIVLLNLAKNEWVKPDITGDIPKPRLKHAACQLYKNEGVIIFGGNLIFNKHKNLDLTNGFLFYYLKPGEKPKEKSQNLLQPVLNKSKSISDINEDDLITFNNVLQPNIFNRHTSTTYYKSFGRKKMSQ